MEIRNKINNLIKKNKIKIIQGFLIFLWLYLIIFNYITTSRLIVFFLILLYIWIYKKLIEKIKLIKPIKNINILILLIYLDRIKLWIIYIIIYIYIWLFDLLEWSNENKIIKKIVQLIKSIIINPILLIIYKFYKLLHIWMSSSLKIILMNRIYGIIFSVLIFIPLLNILLINNWFYIYILIILISILDDSTLRLKKYQDKKLIYYILYIIELLNLNKDIWLILEYRSRVSIFAILIKEGIKEVKDRNNKINKYAFEVNIIYQNILIDSKDGLSEKSIIDYDSKLIDIKIIKMRESFVLIYHYVSFFENFYTDWSSELDYILFLRFSNIVYYKLQKFYILSIEDFEKLNILEDWLYKLIKLILFYLWNVSKILGEDECNIFNDFIISDEYVYYNLIYDLKKFSSDEKLKEVNKVIKNKDFYVHRNYYEQMYLYISVSEFSCFKNRGINYNKYEYINKFIDVYNNDIKILDTEECRELQSLRTVDHLEEEIYVRLDKIRNKLIEEWKEQSKDLSVDNFYEKNNKNLNELNTYVKSRLNK
jgi:hypothetical protein